MCKRSIQVSDLTKRPHTLLSRPQVPAALIALSKLSHPDNMSSGQHSSVAFERQSKPFAADVLPIERETVGTRDLRHHVVDLVVLTDVWNALAIIQSLFGAEPAFVDRVGVVVAHGIAASIVASSFVAEARTWAFNVELRMVADARVRCADTFADGESVREGGGCKCQTQKKGWYVYELHHGCAYV